MKLQITKTKENPILKRKEIEGTIIFQGATPSNKDAAKEIAGQQGTKEECIEMKQIKTEFGKQKATFKAYIYESKEQKDKIEPKTKKQREEEKKAEEAKKKAEEEKKEEKTEEKPAEEQKEENKTKEKEENKE
ncbi:hypothetical protein DRJ22_01905 [Candidatus Woesearchaeota archaeon]|nr:MAG: hypothetical protein DRJ22_01905 [Candidatus Woesearchaeota archaeon]